MSSSKSKTAMKSSDPRVAGKRIYDEELRSKFLIPAHLRFGMVVATKVLDADIGVKLAETFQENHREEVSGEPKAPLVVFVDCKGGGDLGHEIKFNLQKLISEDQVFDISVMEPFLQYGLTCLRHMDDPNKKPPISEKLRIMIAGGDGEVGKILRTLGKKFSTQKVPPIGIIPLGTGNDLSKSFGWGGSLPSAWLLAVERSLPQAAFNRVEQLDRVWTCKQNCLLIYLKMEEFSTNTSALEWMLKLNMTSTIGQKASHPLHRVQYQIKELENILTLHVKKVHRDNWEEVIIPSSIRAITFLNIHNYGGGAYPWGHLKPEYLEEVDQLFHSNSSKTCY
ncbi:diacylglycerol kinase 3-like isoform X3 [Zingiber officinale]|uniref:diacylglycerol kinase 3-like isoform X3 n=1 Tax=Zingiber officinale TaxID=94328 RepID=UPI001C4ABAB8|nr:diacylglycerol kinase 3-like isoform X3 [Zingiber officinale]